MWKLVVVCTAAFLHGSAASDLIVQTQNGKVQGTTFTSPDGSTFYTWRAIPFAKPPVGNLRFQAPEPPENWTDVRDASTDAPACYNVEDDGEPLYGYSEDCLYINVYSPVAPNSSLQLPVMVWIFGGGFRSGGSDFGFVDPTPFLVENVIFVNFNYRLGIFGFLSTNDSVVPGNAALKDQVAAFKWTRDNIANFGGNGSDVTIFGVSAGARSAGFHIISPVSRGLFAAAIMHSGSGLKSSYQSDPRANAVGVAQQLNASITDASSSESIAAVLLEAEADFLVNASGSTFIPVIDTNSPDPFFYPPFYENLQAGNISLVPIIIGTVSEEHVPAIGGESVYVEEGAEADEDPTVLVPDMKLIEGASSEEVGQEIEENYAGNLTFAEDLAAYIHYSGDEAIVRPGLKHAILQSSHTPVYLYRFSYNGTLSADRADIPGCGHVGHGDDIGYLFNISATPIATEADYLTRSRYVKLWTNFAKFKNPTPNDDSAELLQNVTWTVLNTTELQYLDIGDNLEIGYHREAKNVEFWDYLWDTYSYHPYNTF